MQWVIRLFLRHSGFTAPTKLWGYKPRASKALLPAVSAHSKHVKRSIVKYCFTNVLSKSCEHMLQESLALQNGRLSEVGYPENLVVSVAEGLLQKMKTVRQADKNDVSGFDAHKKIAVIPYIHQTSHNLKKIGKRVSVDVMFSAPLKLSVHCKKTNPCKSKEENSCSIAHCYICCNEPTTPASNHS